MDIFSICTAAAWDIEFKQHEQETALTDLEFGRIIFCPQLSFNIEPSERMLFIPYLINKKTKNISFNLKKNHLKGIKADQKHQMCLKSMLASESLCSRKILAVVSPKFVHITRLILGPDSSGVRHALAHSGLRAVATTMT